MDNLSQFERQVDKAFEEKVVQRFVQFHTRIALEAFKEVTVDSTSVSFQHGSPVWSGRFRGSHNLSIGSPVGDNLPPMAGESWPDPVEKQYPAPALAEAAAKLQLMQPFDVVYITNALPYARKIEAGGFSLKAPEGVYNITASRLKAKYNRITIQGLRL